MLKTRAFLNVAFIILMAGGLFIRPAEPVFAVPAVMPAVVPAQTGEQADLPTGDVTNAGPDLTYTTPAGWDYPIVPSDVTGTHTVGKLNISSSYIDWAVRNTGEATTRGFFTCIYLDGTQLICSDHATGLPAGYTTSVTDWAFSMPVTPGNHVLKMVVDANNSVAEANETNNTWERTFTWSDTCPPSSYAPQKNALGGGTILGDAFPRPAEVAHMIALDRAASRARADAMDGPTSNAPDRYDTSAFMTGTVAVGIVLPESSGSMENWTETEMNCVVAKIQKGMDWWKAKGSPRAGLSFVYDVHKAVPTQYEPINESSNDVGLWITESMTSLGYSGANYWEQIYNYTDYLRSHYNTRWAVIYFVADSSNDTDGKFLNSPYFAWTNIGGPYIVMTYDNDGWGIDDMNWVSAHEFGHVFWAADQYFLSGYGGCISTTERYGYLGIPNSNCENGNPNSAPSIMRSNEDALDPSAAGQIGWMDSNSNGVFDVIDTQPAFMLTGHAPNPTAETSWSYSGYVYDQAWTHVSCYDVCNNHDINTNTITSARFRVDSGSWKTVPAQDGAYDNDVEAISFTTPALTVGKHTIEVQAANTRSASKTWTDTVTVQVPTCYALTAAANPPYAGSVTVETAADCAGSRYTAGTTVSLLASANDAYTFSGWSGDAAGQEITTTVSMTQDRTVYGDFNNKAPTLLSVDPSTVMAGGAGFTLTVTGSGFASGAIIRWNGRDLVTGYVNAATLTAAVPADSIRTSGMALVAVYNPAPGGGLSNSVKLHVLARAVYLPVAIK